MKSKDKNTTKPTEKSETTRSSISKRVATMIGTLRHFWSAHWRKILSALAVVVYVLLLLFSCGGLHSKAYESFPERYIPTDVSFEWYGDYFSYSIDPTGLRVNPSTGFTLYYRDSPKQQSYYSIANSPLGSNAFGVQLQYPVSSESALYDITTYTLRWNVVDLSYYYSSQSSLSYDPSYSPLSYISVNAFAGNADDELSYVDAIVHYTTYSSDMFTPDGDLTDVHDYERFQVDIDQSVIGSGVSLYDLIDPPSLELPNNSVITSVELNLQNLYYNSVLVNPDTRPKTNISVYLEMIQYPEWARVSNLEMFRSFLTSIRGDSPADSDDPDDPTYDEGYQAGYAEGKNAGLTQNLGVTRWLTEAGDSVLGMRLFQVHTPSFVDGQYTPILVDVTLGNILSVFLGGFLLIFFLKMFAGG